MEDLAHDESYKKYYPFLLEIRRRLFIVAIVFLIASVSGFFFYEDIIKFSLRLFRLEGINIVFTSPFQFMNLAISSGLLIGIMVVFPILIIQLLLFIKPALKTKEYRSLLLVIPLSLILFLGGFAFGSIMMRYVVAFFYQRSLALDIGNYLDVSKFLSQIMTTSVLMGLAFQFPIVLTVLMRLNIITYSALSQQRIIAYSVSIVFAALLPPTDLVSLIILTTPLIILFEATLLLNRVALKSH